MWQGNAIAQSVPVIQREVLSGGLTLLVSEEHSLPFVTLQMLIDAGAQYDPQDRAGLARLTARTLMAGSKTHSADRINQELDFMGASLNGSAAADFATVTLKVLKKNLDQALTVFFDALASPTFPEGEIVREVERTKAAIQSAEDDPGEVVGKAFQKALFLKGPYDHPEEGTKESLEKITRSDVAGFYNAYYRPNNAILAVTGDISMGEVRAKIIPFLNTWPSREIPRESLAGEVATGRQTILIAKHITQANIILGHEGVSRENPDFYGLTVMNYILGGGSLTSRLMEEIRVKRGLAYSVQSSFDARKHPGAFLIMLQTKNQSARESIDLAMAEMRTMQEQIVSPQELEGAKKYLVGSFPFRFSTQARLVSVMTQIEYFKLGSDYLHRYPSFVGAVTREDVNRLARTYLHPDRLIVVIVADQDQTGVSSQKNR
ncbi:MAG TPA: pitrilysin family protein [Syntrophorhabdaceae bacterium]|nr:pitrilysin family protein [Syntrophorhabdaceae bacterium]